MRRFRFARSLVVEAEGGLLEAWQAESFGLRLLGLARLGALPPGRALLIPACAAVHTWGMRFAVDVAFVEWPPAPGCRVLRLEEGVARRRVLRLGGRALRRTAVLEAPAGALRAIGAVPGAVLHMRPGGTAVTFKPCPLET
jgi:hypothetical protein